MKVVCDTSPLLLLTRADRLDLLSALYSRVVLPSAVLEEIHVQEDKSARHIQAYAEQSHVQRRRARNEVLRRLMRRWDRENGRRSRLPATSGPASSFWTTSEDERPTSAPATAARRVRAALADLPEALSEAIAEERRDRV